MVRQIVIVLFVSVCSSIVHAQDASRPKPVKAMLITGGCCHDYARQKEILKRGIESRAMVEVVLVHSSDKSTQARFDMYDNPDWARGYDVVIHDECSADVKELPYVDNILNAHKNGVAAVNLHCAMHCYRTGRDDWFRFVGLQSTGHGPQKPIDLTFLDRSHPITKGMENWTTINEELYNNLKLFDTAVPLARGRQDIGNRVDDFVVAWANQFGKARVFSTTLGHNNETVGDPRYLDLVTRGLLWSVDKLSPEYLQPFAVPKTELVPVNLARGKKAAASASQSGHPPEHAIDGNADTRWCSPDGNPGQWWQIDLGEPQELTGCQIQWEMDDTNYRYKIEGSADGDAWQLLSDQTKTDLREQTQTLKFAAKGIRFVRLSITGLVAGRWGSFFEIEVHGTKMEKRLVSSGDSFKPKPIKAGGLLSGIKAPAGFEATLFAAPPKISYPVCLATDPTGTVYVGIDENGSLDKKPGRGRIVRCRDTDSDGQADEFTDFAKIDSPRGIVVTSGKQPNSTSLYVLHPPHLSVYHDENGDGTADRSEVLVKNIGFDLNFRGADHTTNGIQIGIDGWIYVAVGDYGFIRATGSDGREVQMKGGGIARVRPDGAELELVSRGQRNIYDVAISPTMDLFTRDNTNDGGGWNVRLSYVPHGAQMGYPSLFLNFPDEIVKPLADYGGGSPCGSLFIDEPTLPGDLGHGLYTCDWGRSIIYRHPLTPNGAGYTAEQESFIEVPRPTDMEIDANGNLYISSWKDGGFNFSGPNVGYVLKIKPPTTETSTPTSSHLASVQGALKQLASPSHTLRLVAQRFLLRQPVSAEITDGLLSLAASEASLPVRVAAIFTLKQALGESSHEALIKLARDAALQEHVLRAIADRETQLGQTSPQPFVEALRDRNPRVRMQAARGLGRFHLSKDRSFAANLAPLTADADPLVAHIAIDSLIKLQASQPCLAALDSPDVSQRIGAARVLQALHEPDVVSSLLEWLKRSDRVPRSPAQMSSRATVLTTLCRLHNREADYTGDWWGTRPDTSGPYYKQVTWSESPRIAEALQDELKNGNPEIVKGLLPQLRRHKVELAGTQELIVKLATQDRAFFPTAIELIAATSGKLSTEAAHLLEVAATIDPANESLRARALRGLQRRLDQTSLFEIIFRSFASVTEDQQKGEVGAAWDEFVREPRLAGLVSNLIEQRSNGGPDEELAYANLVFVSESQQAPKEARDTALKTVEAAWSRPESAVHMLRAIGRSRQEAQILQIQLSLKSDRPDVVAAAQYAVKRLELDKEPPIDPKKPLLAGLKFEEIVGQTEPIKGDAKYGQRLFQRQGCVACHTVSQSEPLKGPLLLDIAKRYKRHELIESIVKPSAKIAQGFEAQFFATSSGKTYDGFVVRESGEEVELRNVAGISIILKKDDIEERGKRETSVMPLGLVDKLNAEQLASILAYMESLKK